MAASGDLFQVTYQSLADGVTCENVIYYRALTPLVTDAAIDAAAERFWLFASAFQAATITYSQMIIKRMTPIALDERIVFPVTTHAGAIGSNPLPNTVAAIFTLRTGTAGKSHRGRFYLPGVPQAFTPTGANTLNATGSAAAVAFANNLISEYGPSGASTALALGVYSRVIGGIHPFTLAGWQQVSHVDPQGVLGNQRRRRPGRGI